MADSFHMKDGKVKGFVLFIDIFSRYLFVRASEHFTAEAVAEILANIKATELRQPGALFSDLGDLTTFTTLT